MSDTPLYDDLRPKFLLIDLPMPATAGGRHARSDEGKTPPMSLSGDALRGVLSALGAISSKRPPVRTYDELAAGLDGALRLAPGGLTAQGAASFAATCAQESDYFRTMTEYGSGQRYAPFIGRGFVQVTWKENYAAFGSWAKGRGLVGDANLFVRDPAALGDYRWAWLGAVWYFERTGLWPYANRGDHLAVSQGVNGGPGRIGSTTFTPHGWEARKRAYSAFLSLGAALLPGGTASAPSTPTGGGRASLREGDTGPAVHALASWLNHTLGAFPTYRPIDLDAVPARQRYGPQTVAAVADFQRRAGVTGPDADGRIVGPRTWAALDRFGYR